MSTELLDQVLPKKPSFWSRINVFAWVKRRRDAKEHIEEMFRQVDRFKPVEYREFVSQNEAVKEGMIQGIEQKKVIGEARRADAGSKIRQRD